MSLKFEFIGEKPLPIKWDGTADEPGGKQMIEAYLSHSKRFTYEEGSAKRTLEYIRVKKEEVEALLSGNAQELVLAFGVGYDSLKRNLPESQQKFTLIMLPVKCDAKNVRKIMVGSVENRFSPCPDQCLTYEKEAPSGTLEQIENCS